MEATQQKRDYYEVLDVDRAATQEQIKQSYRQLALQWHPEIRPPKRQINSERSRKRAIFSVFTGHRKLAAPDWLLVAGLTATIIPVLEL